MPPTGLEAALAELRRVMAAGGTLVLGFIEGAELMPFDHKVVTAHSWPIDELSARLRGTGYAEIERRRRPGSNEPGRRPHAALVALAERGCPPGLARRILAPLDETPPASREERPWPHRSAS